MKLTKTIAILLSSLVLALVVRAATPSPSPAAKTTAADKTSPSSKSSPAAARPTDSDLAVPMEEPGSVPTIQGTPANNNPPKPVLYLLEQQHYTANGKNWVRYRYDVLNKNDYPAAMFAAAPNLPACGSNTNASRTWVDFFDSTGKRLYGFCALSAPADLGKIWFALEEGVIPPSYVYIELNDRQTNTKYKSNLADTTI
ncbi:MAG TPA: hypothetical protein VJU77_06445 [Chthoniobacterales bacterium]|nr:hypothetical protein [Chthoniobacterales bacterium]